ncbi:MAG: hypothetical protein HOV81_02605 [Kofleriaceae bacterium]|nr:hypothetical protein [Kofleriaceae bacterium]
MASALDTIAHVVLPNVMKLKGASTLVGALERRDVSPFAQVWQQTGVEHNPQTIAKEKGDWRVGVLSMPKPSEMGEAYMCAFVAKKNDQTVARYFTLDYDYVLATKTEKTVLCDQEMGRMIKRGDGPPITGDFAADASAFIDAVVDYLNAVKKY